MDKSGISFERQSQIRELFEANQTHNQRISTYDKRQLDELKNKTMLIDDKPTEGQDEKRRKRNKKRKEKRRKQQAKQVAMPEAKEQPESSCRLA